ncbi:MAG: MlaD family protein [Deltaproteobacteria bacterium]|nr:MlaD family protein [Deltaproteobacteria bacterium]
MSKLSVEAKVGVVVVIGLVLLGYMSMKVGKIGFSKNQGYPIEVLFDSASGLARDVTVEQAGVEIGRVQDIRLEDGKALVTLRIKPAIDIKKDARAIIRTRGILGDKYVEIMAGTASAPTLTAGERLVRTVPVTDLDTLMNVLGDVASDIKNLTGALSNVLGGAEGEASVRAIVTNLREVVTGLNQTLQRNSEDFDRIVENLAGFSESLKSVGDASREDVKEIIASVRRVTGNMESLVTDLDEITGKIKSGEGSIGRLIYEEDTIDELNETLASLREITRSINRGEGTLGRLIKEDQTIESLNTTLASLDEITDKINTGQGTIGRLVNDEETVDSLNTTLAQLNTYLEKQETFRTYLDYRGEYQFNSEALKSYVTLRIQPREDKYYLLQVIDDPEGKETVTDTTTDINGNIVESHEVKIERDALKFSAQVAKRYYDFVLRGGLLESTGGFGFDYYFLDDKLLVSLEAFDFSLDRNPHLKTKIDYTPFSHLYITTGYDNFINEDSRSFFIGGGISFSDEDVKTIFSSLPIP